MTILTNQRSGKIVPHQRKEMRILRQRWKNKHAEHRQLDVVRATYGWSWFPEDRLIVSGSYGGSYELESKNGLESKKELV